MKKIILIISLLSLSITVFTYQSFGSLAKEGILEIPESNLSDIDIIKDGNKVVSLNLKYTIPFEYEDKIIAIDYLIPNFIFKDNYISNDEIKINLILENKSSYEYEYRDYSFSIYKNNNDFKIKRVANLAILNLFNTRIATKEMLVDNNLDIKLKNIGYKGIEELDLYYINYYNNLYQTDYESLNDFTIEMIYQVLSGDVFETWETNLNIIKLSKEYWYDNILSIKFEGNNDSYKINNSITYQELINPYFKEYFKNVSSDNTNYLNSIKLKINNLYLPKTYDKYYANFSFRFVFDKITKEGF